jgi:GT2 family glycosyltransferase
MPAIGKARDGGQFILAEHAVPQTIGILVASYGRPDVLRRCLAGIAAQQRPPDDVIIVVRRTDQATQDALAPMIAGGATLRMVMADMPGLIAARNAGVDACRTDILAMVDDDAVPHPDWAARILEHFQRDDRLGGLGGRDRCHDGTGFDDTRASVVGRLQWFGRTVGNHHRGFGDPREVDILKGANMSYRATVFARCRFDVHLRGIGAQPNEDMRFSLQVKSAGWKLVYDPQVLVDHYPHERQEKRFYSGVQPVTNPEAYKELAYNEVAAIWENLSAVRRVAFVLWSLLVGTGVSPGLVQAVRYTPRLGWMSWRRFHLNMVGKFAAIRDLGWGRPSPREGRVPLEDPR